MDNNVVERAESAASRDTAYHEQLYSQHYKIGEFAAMTGMSTSRVRFYERAGLFESRREENGYRYYTAHDAFRANAFRVLLQYGYSVDDAIRMLDAPQDTEELTQALSEQLASLERQHEQIHRRMRRIESSLEVLSLQQSKRFSLVDEPD